ncbi:flagellar hook protein FlgE [Devosia subaequoris]|uniref:Flagellar hook protein FlgE n=1 Tax=Devosia subaequoris TaxID=395930 RepID=A0A7W6IN58_9HYPH|nr:flagellar hook protein FlgE [Devosia subaequoris]MCP1209840.1 hypothetical protein [Devosia subaequoris]
MASWSKAPRASLARAPKAPVELSSEMVNVIGAEANFKASAKVVSVASDMSKALLDILA